MARRRVRVKPGKAQSAMGFIVGIVFVLIGLFMVVPMFGLFGLMWTGMAAWSSVTPIFSLLRCRLYRVDFAEP